MPKIVDHDEKRLQIAEAACNTIAEYGLAGSSMRMIARAANCSTGTLTHYFPDKNALLVAAINFTCDRQIKQILAITDNQPEDLLTPISNLLPIAPQHQVAARIFLAFWNRSTNTPQINQLQYGLHERYQELVMRILQNAKVSSPEQIPCIAERILTFINGMTIRAVMEPENWPTDKQIAELQYYLQNLLGQTFSQ